jgi:hypothetical protein
MFSYMFHFGGGISQSVKRVAVGWTTEGSEFESLHGQVFFFVLRVNQTSSKAHPASYPVVTRELFPRGKGSGAWS